MVTTYVEYQIEYLKNQIEYLKNQMSATQEHVKMLDRKLQVQTAHSKRMQDQLDTVNAQVRYVWLIKQHKKDSPKMRGKVLPWAGWRCMCCGKQRRETELHLDAVRPLKNGMALDWDNVQLLCSECNQTKGTREGPEWDFRKNVPEFLKKCEQAMGEERQQSFLDWSRKYNPLHNEADWSRHGFGPG